MLLTSVQAPIFMILRVFECTDLQKFLSQFPRCKAGANPIQEKWVYVSNTCLGFRVTGVDVAPVELNWLWPLVNLLWCKDCPTCFFYSVQGYFFIRELGGAWILTAAEWHQVCVVSRFCFDELRERAQCVVNLLRYTSKSKHFYLEDLRLVSR